MSVHGENERRSGVASDMLDIAGVADHMTTSQRHVRRLVHDRRIPFLKVGGLVRFRRADIDRWLDEHSVEPEAS